MGSDRMFSSSKLATSRGTLSHTLAYVPMCIRGANPAFASYNATAVKTYKATSNLVQFEKYFYDFEISTILLQRWRCSCTLTSRRIGSWIQPIYN
jgi:hypothetical protein